MKTKMQELAEVTIQMNGFRREAQALLISSSFRQKLFMGARLKGASIDEAKEASLNNEKLMLKAKGVIE